MNQALWERSPLEPNLIVAIAENGPWGTLPVSYLEETTSTNLLAKDFLRQRSYPATFALVSDFQSTGRGRLNRIWQAPKQSSILMSLVEDLSKVKNHGWLNLWAALVVRRCLIENFDLEVLLKWPNDLVVVKDNSYLKFGGILSEIYEDKVIFGIGINYSQDQNELPTLVATSLKLLGAKEVARETFIADLLNQIHGAWKSEATHGQFPSRAVVREYESASYSLGRPVEVSLPNGEIIKGKAVGLSPNGALLVETATGLTVTITAGDVN